MGAPRNITCNRNNSTPYWFAENREKVWTRDDQGKKKGAGTRREGLEGPASVDIKQSGTHPLVPRARGRTGKRSTIQVPVQSDGENLAVQGGRNRKKRLERPGGLVEGDRTT